MEPDKNDDPNHKSLILWRIPRTGTTSIRRGLVAAGVMEMVGRKWDRTKLGVVSFGHATPTSVAIDKLATIDELTVTPGLVVVRNPWERLVSLFCLFHQRADGTGLKILAKRYAPTFSAYIDWCISGERVADYHAGNLQARRQTAWLVPDAIHTHRIRMTADIDFYPPSCFVGRFDALPLIWQWLCKWFECSGELPHQNGSRHGPYQEYYSPADAAKVAEHYAREIELFGFRFEGGR